LSGIPKEKGRRKSKTTIGEIREERKGAVGKQAGGKLDRCLKKGCATETRFLVTEAGRMNNREGKSVLQGVFPRHTA